MKVAIQGELGSFSHEAAGKCCRAPPSFHARRSAEVFDSVERGSVNAAVIPIENSLAGSLTNTLTCCSRENCLIHARISSAHSSQPDRASGVTLANV